MKRHLSFGFLAIIFSVFLGAVGCTKKTESVSATAAAADPVAAGRKLYMQYCIACHNSNPKEDGLIGPANAGSSLELVQLKVLKGEYPAGYKPKRPTKSMAPLPMIKDDDIKAIHAYLNAP